MYSIDHGVRNFTGIITSGEYLNWLISIDVYFDTRRCWSRRSTTETYEANFAPTINSIPNSIKPLDESVIIADSLEELMNDVDKYQVNWLSEPEAKKAYSSLI